ncbi:RNA polymerase sigma factor [Patescibacteria group bacterium]
MNEKRLVLDILAGKKKAINYFYKNYKPELSRYISKKISNSKDGEEILHDTFLSALDSLPIFKFNSSLLTWLKAIARHEVIDFYRKKKIKTLVFSRFPFLEKLIDKALSPELALQEKETKEKIFATFKALSEGYSEILRLKYIEGQTYAEIAEKLGKSVKAVESKLGRARLAFQKEYAKEYKTNTFKDWKILNSSFNKGELPFK